MSDIADLFPPLNPSRDDVMSEIRGYLEPFAAGKNKPLPGETIIIKDLTIDSVDVMDMVMELEDRFDVSISMVAIAEIHTIDELADEVIRLLGEKQGT